jgi:prepilin peptidase CpaA
MSWGPSAPLLALVLVLLAMAAWRDIATRTIPDTVSLLLVIAGVLWRTLNGVAAVWSSSGMALLLFMLLLAAHARGMLGGGDVKLMTAIAVGLSPFDCLRFIIATAIAGGVLAITYLVISYQLRGRNRAAHSSFLNRVAAIESWRIRRRASLPYGVAIAAGGAFVLLWSGDL